MSESSKAEAYRQQCERVVVDRPMMRVDGHEWSVMDDGGLCLIDGGLNTAMIPRESVPTLIAFLRDTFEPPIDDTAEPVTDQRPEPEVPEMTVEEEDSSWRQYIAGEGPEVTRQVFRHAYRAGALEMDRRWREREGRSRHED